MIQIQIDTKQIQAMVGAVDTKQIQFATARALTKTAQAVQQAVRAEMPSRFTLRRQWIVQGIRITPATKANLTATIYSKDAFMERQEYGGIKMGTPGGGNFSSTSLQQPKGKRVRPAMGRVAVPTEKVRRNKSEIIRKSELPAGLGERGFVIGKPGDTQYLAKRFAKGKRAGLQILYVLKRSTKVKPRLGLRDIGIDVVRSKFAEIFSQSLSDAIATAKKS